MHKFSYKWYLKDGYPAPGIEKHNKRVFSTFACGGGSSMGYKLAGYDVIGANDIDPQMAKVYKQNHNPKYYFECPISDLLTMDLPDELYNLDVLDGSPPCSTFSLAGSREKNWKKNKVFREGQSEQILSDLFFDWIKLVKRLQPKVAIAENVKGMLIGNAKLYTKQIVKELEAMGYTVQVFMLNAASMGVPQRRERVFFICNRINRSISLKFEEMPIKYKEIFSNENQHIVNDFNKRLLTESKPFETSLSHVKERLGMKATDFNAVILDKEKVLPTIASASRMFNREELTLIDNKSLALAGTFPLDYNYMDIKPQYLIGMSVPPVMMAQVSSQVYKQLLSKLE